VTAGMPAVSTFEHGWLCVMINQLYDFLGTNDMHGVRTVRPSSVKQQATARVSIYRRGARYDDTARKAARDLGSSWGLLPASG
jgi:hypothetical protein